MHTWNFNPVKIKWESGEALEDEGGVRDQQPGERGGQLHQEGRRGVRLLQGEYIYYQLSAPVP